MAPTSINNTAHGIWITRSGALTCAEKAAFAPHTPTLYHAPTLRFATVDTHQNALAQPASALIFTSVQGVLNAKKLRAELTRLPAYAVGEQTAKAALHEGFDVRAIGKEGAEHLANLLTATQEPPAETVLCLGAEEPAYDIAGHLREAGWPAQHVAVYRSEPATSLPDELVNALRAGEIHSVFLSSAKGAKAFLSLAQHYGAEEQLAKLTLYVMSDAVAKTVAEFPQAACHVASAPRMPLLIQSWLRYGA